MNGKHKITFYSDGSRRVISNEFVPYDCVPYMIYLNKVGVKKRDARFKGALSHANKLLHEIERKMFLSRVDCRLMNPNLLSTTKGA